MEEEKRYYYKCRICGMPLIPSKDVLVMDKYVICTQCNNRLREYYIKKFIGNLELLKEMSKNTEFAKYFKYDDVEESDEDEYIPKNSMPSYRNIVKMKPKNNILKIDCLKIYNKIIQNIIGQNEAVKTVLSIIIRNQMTNNPHLKSNMFLIGGTR